MTAPRPAFRPDVEGLRAVAVAAVVAEHLIGLPAGGFAGVDVFFVISGFVITTGLLGELDATGTVSLTAFYARRARRILPAAGLVVATVVVVASLLWLAPRAWATGLDALASLLFVENWHLVALGTDYLAADRAVSPLQHYWSLAVEEQFYLLWPVLVLAVGLVVRLARRGPAASRRLLAAAFSGVLLLSVAWCAWRTGAAPAAAYFDSVGRTWELAAGGLAALAAPSANALPLAARRAVTLVGQGLVVASALLLGPALAGDVVAFPWPWAVLPVAGTVLVVGAGTGSLGPVEAVLVSRPARWIGRRSYSLYLWHFPVLVFAASLGLAGPGWLGVQLGAVLLLSAASYRFVERGVQRSGWLRAAARHPAPHPGAARGGPARRPAAQVALAAAVGVVLVGTSAAQLKGPAWLVDPAAARSGLAAVAGAAPSGTTVTVAPGGVTWDEASLRSALDAAVARADEVPSTLLDEAFTTSSAPQIGPGGCRYDVGTDPRALRPCATGPASSEHVAVVVGDSIALSWMPAVVEALGPGWRVLGLGIGSCSTIEARFGSGGGDDGFSEACARSRQDLVDFVDRTAPELVVTSSSAAGIERLTSGATGVAAEAEWRRATAAAVQGLSGARAGAAAPAGGQAGTRVVVLGAPPRGASPVACATRATGAALCAAPLEARATATARAEAAGVADAVAAGVDAVWVDVTPWFTTSDGLVPVTAGPLLVRWDSQHLTAAMSRSLAGLVRPGLLSGTSVG